ncbi:MAG: hypothetical protein R3343_02715 [Nitriliruptorales bacterium]|nr:hypothetical protein [Nitriliruptorales bacterium]
MSASPAPERVIPLLTELGVVLGHRFTLLSVESWSDWFDLRFARVDLTGERPLPRRVPPAGSWRITTGAGLELTVEDAVGRGDRHLSIGEVRVRPRLPASATELHVSVEVAAGEAPLDTRVAIPPP